MFFESLGSCYASVTCWRSKKVSFSIIHYCCRPSLRTGNVYHSLYRAHKPLSLFTFGLCLTHEGLATTAPVMRLP